MTQQQEQPDYRTRLKQYRRRQAIATAAAGILVSGAVVLSSAMLISVFGLDAFLVLLVLIVAFMAVVGIIFVVSKWLDEEPPQE